MSFEPVRVDRLASAPSEAPPPAASEIDAAGARLAFVVAVALCLLFSITILSRPVVWLLGVVPDDAFYYLQIARHLALDGRSTFDGINLTNGYHPAWMLLLTPFAKLIPDRVMLLRVCLAIALTLHLATGLLLRFALRRMVGEFWAWIGAALWLINPISLLLALQGMETSLYLPALVLVLWCYVERIDPHLRPGGDLRLSARDLALFGLTLGLAALARTEALVLTAAALGFLVVLRLLRARERGEAPPIREIARILLLAGGVCLLCLLPWLLYCRIALGHFDQTSGSMKMIWAAADNSRSSLLNRVRSAFRTINVIWFKLPTSALLDETRHVELMEIPLLAALAGLVLFSLRRPWPGLSARLMFWLLTSLVLIDGIYGLFFSDSQFWYSGLPVLVFFLAALNGLARAASGGEQGRRIAALASGAAALCLFLHFWLHPLELYPHQRDVYASQPRFNSLAPAGARIGSLNAGIPGYFSDRPIVNLDGLVNDAVSPYWRKHQLEQYLADQHIEYITDETGALHKALRFCTHPFSVTVIATAPLRGWKPPVRNLWKVGL